MGMKDQLLVGEAEGQESAVRRWFRKTLGHVGLLAALVVYTAVGGWVFKRLEYPGEVRKLEALEQRVLEERSQLITAFTNRSQLTAIETLSQLERYEAVVQEAAQGGLLVPFTQGVQPPSLAKWSYLQAVFFASTVLTTIGYGNITPATVEGRLFCMLFALVGIPLTVSVMADLGVLLARRLPSPPEAKGLRSSLTSAAVATSILLIYIAFGSFLFISWETEWTFFDGFYFCFVTMTTIGFGDLVPSTPQYMLMCTVYIILGLSLTSTIIEVMRQQYSHSWTHLQMYDPMFAGTPQYMLMCTVYIILGLSLTSTIIEVMRQQYSHSWKHLQALAESLGKLAAERGSADVQTDLKRILSMHQGHRPRDLHKAVKQMSQELQKQRSRPRVIQIVVYESSV